MTDQSTNQNHAQTQPQKRITRRDFLKLAALATSVLALPHRYTAQIAKALANAPRLPVVWLEFQDCTGDSESLLRASNFPDPLQAGVVDPDIVSLLLEAISLEYHETIMAPSGANAEKSLADVIAQYPGGYLCVVEGSIPVAEGGIYCIMHGQTAASILQEVCASAKATIAVGSCAVNGGLAAALPNPTGAVGVKDAVPGLTNLLNLPGCPANVVNLVAAIVHLITFDQLPPANEAGLPYFAYGEIIHDHCERRIYHDELKFVVSWGDEGHQRGWCLLKMGCRGTVTRHNCPQVKWNEGVGWPVGAGHGCVGCANPQFWDLMTPFYQPLPED